MSSPRRRHRELAAVRRLSVLVAAALVLVALPTQSAADDLLRVMPLGDSITDGYDVPGGYRIDLEDLLVSGGQPVDFVGSLANGPTSLADRDHEGHSGWRIDQLSERIDGWMASSRPDVVLLKIGTNDINRAYQVDTAPQRLSRLIDQITTARPSTTVLVATLAPLGWDDREQRIRTFNAALPGLVRDQVGRGRDVRLVDVHAALTTRDLADGIHPTAAGYDKMARVWYAALRDVLEDGGPVASPSPSAPPPSPSPSPSSPSPSPTTPPAPPPTTAAPAPTTTAPPPPPPPTAPAPPPPPPPSPPAPPLSDQTVTTRLAGADRYATAAAISRSAFPSAVPVVVVATGDSFADALGAGPAADRLGGPVLPVARDRIPAPVRAELDRLDPARIVVLGGTAAVSDAVVAELDAFTPGPVTRLAGADRYATAASVAREAFAAPVARAVVASGLDAADALAGGAVGALTDSPVLLVAPDRLPPATAAVLRDLQPRDITVLGGTRAVSDAVLEQLRALAPGSVTRVAGADRYATATRAAEVFWPQTSDVVYLATGQDFPDALAGVPAAGRDSAPLLLVRPGCMPATTAAALERLRPTTTVVLGGTATVSPAAADGVVCAG